MLCVGRIVAWSAGLWEILRRRKFVGGVFRGVWARLNALNCATGRIDY